MDIAKFVAETAISIIFTFLFFSYSYLIIKKSIKKAIEIAKKAEEKKQDEENENFWANRLPIF